MAETRVHSVDMSWLQSACWSQDNRLAVSADKEIIIMKLNTEASGRSEFCVNVSVTLSLADLADKYMLWDDLDQILQSASRGERSSFMKKWTYCSLALEDQIQTSWTTIAWSPPGLALNNRTVLAALTHDHRIVIMGQLAASSKWTQVADLGHQLLTQHAVEYKEQILNLPSANSQLKAIYRQMTSVAAVDLAWSSVFDGGPDRSQFVLLFVAMKNTDLVIFRLQLPCTGQDSCTIVGRQPAKMISAVTSLVWTALPDSQNSGLLAVGHEDGAVEVQWFHWEPDESSTCPQLKVSQMLQHSDHLPVSSLAWHKCEEMGLTLLCTQFRTVSAFVCGVGHCSRDTQQEGGMEVEGGGEEWEIQVTGTCHVQLAGGLTATGLQSCRGTVVMSTMDGSLYSLSVSNNGREPVVTLDRKLPFLHEESGWSCSGFSLSPNAALCIAMSRPHFAFNHLSDRFRNPTEIHICPVLSADLTSLEQLLCPQRVSRLAECRTDVLALAHRVVCQEAVTKADVARVVERLTGSPFTDTLFGCMVARHVLSSLSCIIKKNSWSEEMEEITAAETRMTQTLLCGQAGCVLTSRLHDKQHTLLDIEMDFTAITTLTCTNNHKFGVCCHTLLLCDTVHYQCCSTCGALASSVRQLKALPWLQVKPSVCALCGSHMYGATTILRL